METEATHDETMETTMAARIPVEEAQTKMERAAIAAKEAEDARVVKKEAAGWAVAEGMVAMAR